MALFSYKIAKGLLQLILESGTAPLNLLGLQDAEAGIDFSPKAMLSAVKSVCGTTAKEMDDKGEWSSYRARPADMAEGRLYMQKINDADADKVATRLRALLEKMGHQLEREPRNGTFHLMEGPGGTYLAVPGAYARVARSLAKDVLGYNPQSFEHKPDTPGEPYHRLVLKEGDAIRLAVEIEAKNEAITDASGLVGERPVYHVLNHTAQPLLKSRPEVVITRPFLVTAKRGAEMHLLRGNLVDVTKALKPELIGAGDNGSLLLRGKSDEQMEALREVKKLIPSLDLRAARNLVDTPEDHPKVVVASKAADIVNTRLESTVAVSQASIAKVEAYKLKESRLEPQQALGAAFIVDNDRTLNADATGGGKTLMTAVGLHLKTPPGQKILVVCPPGIIAQWVRCIDKFLPDLDGPEALDANKSPAWMKRMPVTEQDKLAASWERVRRRFVFVPESALESGVEMGWGKKLKAEEDNPEAQNALVELNSILQEPIGSLLVDEAHQYRNSGPKFALLEGIANRITHDRGQPVNVVLATATPLHRDAPDLFPLLRLLGLNKFRKMEVKEFCEEYCYPKATLSPQGVRKFAAPVPPYGYGMLREDNIPEIARILGERMIARDKHELAPNRIRSQVVASPLPYAPSGSLGVALDGFRQEGTLVKLPAQVLEQLSNESSYMARSILLANAKVPQTIADVKAFLADPANEGEKMGVYSQFNLVAASIAAELKTAGIESHRLTGGMNGRAGKGTVNYMLPSGRGLATKQQLVDDFIRDKNSRVWVATIGAGGTGIDGLHTVAREALINDATMSGGTQAQLEGRHCRTESEIVALEARGVHIHYQVANHPADIRANAVMVERRHESEFIRKNGLLQGLDSPEAKIRCEIMADAFRKQIEKQIGETEIVPQRDNTYLLGLAVEDKVNYVLDLSPLPPVAEPVFAQAKDEAGMSIRAIAPPITEEPRSNEKGLPATNKNRPDEPA